MKNKRCVWNYLIDYYPMLRLKFIFFLSNNYGILRAIRARGNANYIRKKIICG